MPLPELPSDQTQANGGLVCIRGAVKQSCSPPPPPSRHVGLFSSLLVSSRHVGLRLSQSLCFHVRLNSERLEFARERLCGGFHKEQPKGHGRGAGVDECMHSCPNCWVVVAENGGGAVSAAVDYRESGDGLGVTTRRGDRRLRQGAG
mmetsp:Transcript_24981/g.63594  ORF Transcript_24981/g.63594 Transcript_24981/m.63594 type:complete len:147 (-) Transcript_24981:265-705(-)